ncbi:MAG: helix-turn-helix domain-containing protein, partial [Thermofilaceae archaeon]
MARSRRTRRRVYEKLLELGQGTAGDLARALSMSRGTVHYCLRELQREGVVSARKLGNRRVYTV